MFTRLFQDIVLQDIWGKEFNYLPVRLWQNNECFLPLLLEALLGHPYGLLLFTCFDEASSFLVIGGRKCGVEVSKIWKKMGNVDGNMSHIE